MTNNCRGKNIEDIFKILSKTYPDAKCQLNFKTPYELLVATILSAQCTDKRVNIITEELFKEYNTPKKMIELTEEQLGEIIKSCGLYRNKSKNILKTTKKLLDDHNGNVPRTMDELIKLPGVGRKTANVVLSNAYGIPAIAVDTHVFRISNRIGIVKGDTPHEVEKQLMKCVPKHMWIDFHHYLICHGRDVCKSRNPRCNECSIMSHCNYKA